MSTTTTMTTTSDETQTYKKGEHYVELETPVKHAPPVIAFFSLLDPTSRMWTLEYNIVNTIRRQVPAGTEISRYHSSSPYAQELGNDLTHAWAVARSLEIDDKIIEPLFEAIHGETKIIDMQGVKAVFDHVGIPPLRYDRESRKPGVRADADWMEECKRKMNIKTIPAIIVAGRYQIRLEAFGDELNADKVADAVKDLLLLK